jgi:hypothetical protein
VSAGLPYLRRRGRRLTRLLLPALLLRALIPFGFMPVVAGGGLTIGFCPGESAPLAALTAHHSHSGQSGHQHAPHAGGDGGIPGTAAHHAPCLFAASATPAFTPAILAVAVCGAGLALRHASASDTLFLPTILRAQSSRAPPLAA